MFRRRLCRCCCLPVLRAATTISTPSTSPNFYFIRSPDTHAHTHAHTTTATTAEEEKELTSHLETCLREEADHRWLPAEGDDDDALSRTHVLASANKIFLKIRSSLTRCIKLISNGQTLLEVSGLKGRAEGTHILERGASSAAALFTGREGPTCLPLPDRPAPLHYCCDPENLRQPLRPLFFQHNTKSFDPEALDALTHCTRAPRGSRTRARAWTPAPTSSP